MDDLRLDVELVCVEYDAFLNRSTCIEVKHKVLINKLKDEL